MFLLPTSLYKINCYLLSVICYLLRILEVWVILKPPECTRLISIQTFFFRAAESASPVVGIGAVKAKMDTYLHPSALQWASGNNEEAWQRGGQPSLATQWGT